jgi:hypothetical protein
MRTMRALRSTARVPPSATVEPSAGGIGTARALSPAPLRWRQPSLSATNIRLPKQMTWLGLKLGTYLRPPTPLTANSRFPKRTEPPRAPTTALALRAAIKQSHDGESARLPYLARQLSLFRSPGSKFSAALLRGSMANRRRQGFRLVRAMALHPVWVLYVPHDQMLDAYNRVLASGCVRLNGCEREREEGPAPPYVCSGLGYICLREGGTSPLGNGVSWGEVGCPTRVLSGPLWLIVLRRFPSQVLFARIAVLPDMSSGLCPIPVAGDGAVVLAARPHPDVPGAGLLFGRHIRSPLRGSGGRMHCSPLAAWSKAEPTRTAWPPHHMPDGGW